MTSTFQLVSWTDLHGFNTWSWNKFSWSIKHILDLPKYKLSAFCQKISQLHKIVTYVPNKWITDVLTEGNVMKGMWKGKLRVKKLEKEKMLNVRTVQGEQLRVGCHTWKRRWIKWWGLWTNHVDDLVHRIDSPFITSINSHPLPSKFKMPSLDSLCCLCVCISLPLIFSF